MIYKLISGTLLLFLLSSCHQSSDSNSSRSERSNIIPSPPKTPEKITQVFQRNIQVDLTTLKEILEQGEFIDTTKSWNVKALFVKVDDSNRQYYYYYNSIYQDTNRNQIQDSQDEGFFNPASTVKVGIAALVLEELKEMNLPKETKYRIVGSSQWYSFAGDIKKVLVISDNQAANRLILFLGFENLNFRMRAKGLKYFSVNRLMLDRGTLAESPAFELRFNSTTTQSPPQTVSQDFSCFEVREKLGNCATATDLIEILMRLVNPDVYSPQEKFNLRESDRFWLQEIMSQTPKEAGFNYEDTFCRFLHPLSKNIANTTGRLLSKCGVGLFSHSFIDTSFLETNQGQKYYIFWAVNPPNNVSKNQAIDWMNKASAAILTKLSGITVSTN